MQQLNKLKKHWQMKNKIKQYFKDVIKSPTGLNKRIKNAPLQLINYCENILINQPQWQKISFVILGIYKDLSLNICATCGKKLTYSQTIKANRRNSKCCSRKCMLANQLVRKQMRQKKQKTCLQKYGSKYPAQSKDIKLKMQQTCLQKYGTIEFLSSKHARNKIKETNLEKYGVENVFATKDIQEKIKHTISEKYGTQYYVQSTDFKLKAIESFQNNFGVNTPFQSKEIQNKAKNTVIQRYGVQNNFQTPENIAKCNEVKFEKVWKTILSWHQYIIPLFTKEQYAGRYKQYKWKCVKCGNQFYQELGKRHINKDLKYIPRCLCCYPYIENNGISYRQKQLAQFCKQYFPELQQNNRQLIKPYQLDILIPQLKLAIEFNGIYWHNENCVESGYHLMKTQMCQKLGYRLIHVWEDQWENNKEQIKQKLIKVFNNTEDNFNQHVIKLNRDWYTNKNIINYKLVKIQQPEILQRYSYLCENCGYLIYERIEDNN